MKRQAANFWIMRTRPGDREAITALAEREGVPAAEAVRAAVRKALQEKEERPARAEALSINGS